MLKRNYLMLAMLLVLCFVLPAGAEEADTAAQFAAQLGPLTLLPPLVAITLAFITKNVVFSLFIGVFCGTFLLNVTGNNIFFAFIGAFSGVVNQALASLSDSWNAGIVLQCLTIGGVIALITKMGGAKAVAEALAKKATNACNAQILTFIAGLFIFFDDYANSLIVGPIMRPVSDKFKISREKLAFIIDSTAAPIAGIALISTWIGYELSLIKDAYASIGQPVSAYAIFLETLPFRFYNILILAFVIISACFLRDFGPMGKAQQRAFKTGDLADKNSKVEDTAELRAVAPKEGIKLNIWNALIPIGVLIVASFIGFYVNGYSSVMSGEDQELIKLLQTSPYSFVSIREAFSASDASIVLFQGALLGSIVALAMGAMQKIFTLKEGIDIWVKGIKSLVITGVILILAWSLSGVIKELGTAKFLVSILSDVMPAFILPAVIFILGSIISFATGTSYGTMGILMPLAVPLAFAISPDHAYVCMSVGAVLTGAIFGDHCSPISDTTILSSMGASCDHLDHVRTQIPYSLTVAAITVLLGYIPSALGVPLLIVFPLTLGALAGVIYFVGKPNMGQ